MPTRAFIICKKLLCQTSETVFRITGQQPLRKHLSSDKLQRVSDVRLSESDVSNDHSQVSGTQEVLTISNVCSVRTAASQKSGLLVVT